MPRIDTATHDLRLAADVGGTFTDVVAVDSTGHVTRHKTLSTPSAFETGVVVGLEACINGHFDRICTLLHASTVATNAILERRGPRTGLLTTEGFRDVLEIGRLRYPRLYDLQWSRSEPLVDRQHRLGVSERISSNGAVVQPLDQRQLEHSIDVLIASKIEAVAICLINAYVNDQHEKSIAAIVRKKMPDVAISESADILPLIGEYDRTSTTVINAFLQPVVGAYLRRLDTALRSRNTDAALLMLQSSGGVIPATTAAQRPAFVLESGPTAGVMSAAQLARDLDLPHVLAFDMGGTTAKAAVIKHGEPAFTPELEVGAGMSSSSRLTRGAGYLLRTPSIDLVEIGAGGGSIATVDEAGGISVGPTSAGADPGPACYGLGGRNATLTDATVVLGHINPASLLGSSMTLDARAAERVVEKKIARPLGTSLIEAADAVHRIAAAELARAMRAVTSERGIDPKMFTLIAFGGGGPGMAAALANTLNVQRVVIPPGPGVFSATGLLGADLRWMSTQSTQINLTSPDAVRCLATELKKLQARCASLAKTGGFHQRDLSFEMVADCRYFGQSFELGVPIPPGRITRRSVSEICTCFESLHLDMYGHRDPDGRIFAAALRVTAVHPSSPVRMTEALATSRHIKHRKAWFNGTWQRTPILRRGDVRVVDGPAIVEDYDATTVVPPGWKCSRQDLGGLVLEHTS